MELDHGEISSKEKNNGKRIFLSSIFFSEIIWLRLRRDMLMHNLPVALL
jgi:hypothetical protein